MVPVDEALRTIRDAWPSNADFLDDLKERVTGPQPIPLVPFVGAGLSVPMGFPSWRGFLTELAAECGMSEEVAALLDEGRYEKAAGTVEEGWGRRSSTRGFGTRSASESPKSASCRAPFWRCRIWPVARW
jgi:hypothetical protein